MKERGCYLIAMRRFPSQASEGQGTLKGIAVWKLQIVPIRKDFPEKIFWTESLLKASCAWRCCGDCWNGEGCAVRRQPRSMAVWGRVPAGKKYYFFSIFFSQFFLQIQNSFSLKKIFIIFEIKMYEHGMVRACTTKET